jgi:spore germination protein GerM
MKTRLKKVYCLSLLVFSLQLVFVSAAAQTKEVKIYLMKFPYDNSDNKNPHSLQPVTRRVSAKSPLRAALISLTDGPTAAEKEQGFDSPTYGIKLLSVKTKRGVAYTYFTMPEEARFSGDGSPFIFQDAVERTAMQFPNVRKVIICLDGILDFGSESGEPPRKCPR